MSTEAKVTELPQCDLCAHLDAKNGVEAHYDVKTTFGPWANVCDKHLASHGPATLGTGQGQRLVVTA